MEFVLYKGGGFFTKITKGVWMIKVYEWIKNFTVRIKG